MSSLSQTPPWGCNVMSYKSLFHFFQQSEAAAAERMPRSVYRISTLLLGGDATHHLASKVADELNKAAALVLGCPG